MKPALRRTLVAAALPLAAALALFFAAQPQAAEVQVYKSPTCGCCKAWIAHLEEHGFAVQAHDVADVTPYKIRHGVTPALGSCHTALVEGYVIEGHVPADDIKRLLEQRPAVRGLSVPGMPMGSPGMEGPYKEPYRVLSFDAEGKTEVFASH